MMNCAATIDAHLNQLKFYPTTFSQLSQKSFIIKRIYLYKLHFVSYLSISLILKRYFLSSALKDPPLISACVVKIVL